MEVLQLVLLAAGQQIRNRQNVEVEGGGGVVLRPQIDVLTLLPTTPTVVVVAAAAAAAAATLRLPGRVTRRFAGGPKWKI
jgi:hypothetical protein